MSKKQTTTQQINPWSGAVPLLKDAVGQTQQAGVEGFRVNPYTGPRVAQYSPMTMQGIDEYGNLGNTGIADEATKALTSNLMMDDFYRNADVIKGTVADDVKSNLASTFAGGAINSGMAGDTYTRAMTEALAGVEYDAYNAAKNRQMGAISAAPSIQDLWRGNAAGKLTAGGMMDDLTQANINADMASYYEGENADMDALKQYSALASGFGGLGSSGTGTEKAPLDWGGILGGGGALLQGLSLFSDRRLKKNIRRIGETAGGTPVYSYEYIWGGGKQIGVMADEVPYAVAGQVNGFDVVDYGAVK